MEHLPPMGWGDVASKRDLDFLRVELEATIHREVSALKSTFVWTMVASQAPFASVILAAVKLL